MANLSLLEYGVYYSYLIAAGAPELVVNSQQLGDVSLCVQLNLIYGLSVPHPLYNQQSALEFACL